MENLLKGNWGKLGPLSWMEMWKRHLFSDVASALVKELGILLNISFRYTRNKYSNNKILMCILNFYLVLI